jgi:CRISPR system Cascade subunit CasC
MLIQIHILQNYAPSNLNRDDTGSPKDAVFGGVQRGRISSQCLKRSIRKSQVFEESFKDGGLLGERTRQLPTMIQDELSKITDDKEAIAAIVARVPEIGRESKKKNKDQDESNEPDEETPDEGESEETAAGATKQLIFIDRKKEVRPLAEKLLAIFKKVGAKDWGKLKIPEITKDLDPSIPRSIDIAMFGRMTTSQAFKNVQASTQVAHALSTNALKTEFDYYTAMDDLKPDDTPGADMIGDVEFNSCTYYKYINVSWNGLLSNLGGEENISIARQAVLALLEAAATAHPSGKQNSFAAFSPADFVLVEISDRNLPVSYVNAFVQPINGNNRQSLLTNSQEALSVYASKLVKAYNLDAQRAFMSINDLPFMDLKAAPSLKDLKQWLEKQLPQA